MKKSVFFILILFTAVLISCNNGMGSDSISSSSETSAAQIVTDASKGVVFVDEDGTETVVKTEEDGEEIICKDVIDYVLIDDEEPASKKSVKTIGRKRAVVLGYRSDGCPGLWIVYSGGIVRPVVNSEDIETSELLELAEARQPLFKHFGWNYKALDMAVNEKEIIIAGYAENEEGIPWWWIDPGTTIGVYWSVVEDDDGYYHISRAKVVGYRDNDWWKTLRDKMKEDGYRYRWRWLRRLRLFFFGWYDRYMTMTESVEVGENPGEYIIKGTDDEGEAALATVTVWKVLSIEKAPDDPEPSGNIIVYASDSDGDLEIYSLDYTDPSASPVKLTDNNSDDKHPALSKDGSRIAFVSDEKIYTMNSDGSNVSPALVSLSGADDGHPSWNNDGSRIVYDDGGDLYVIDSDGANKANITNSGTVEIKPSWRSSSNKIVYERGSDIFETDASGSSHTKLTTAAFVLEGDPSLSPDGSRIAFTRKTSGFYNIYIMNKDDSNLTSLTDSSSDESSPAWSSDGSKIAYVRGNAVYYKNADSTGSETLITDNGQNPSW